MITENLSTLKIHKLTQAQYDRELLAGNIDDHAIYLTPDEAITLADLGGMSATNPVGTGSFSMNRKAGSSIGSNSTTIGSNNIASSMCATAIGQDNTSSAMVATTIGTYNTAKGLSATAIGQNNESSGMYSLTIGLENTSSKSCATAIGQDNVSNGQYSISIGLSNETSGDGAFAAGRENTATSNYASAIGLNNSSNGASSFAAGANNTASSDGSCALCSNNASTGLASFAAGSNNTSAGDCSTSFGFENQANAEMSFAVGGYNIASGQCSFVGGHYNESLAHQFVFGHYNNTTIATEGVGEGTSSGAAFVIGNGTNTTKSNAFRVAYDGTVYAKSRYMTTGADYAEFFEWKDLNPNAEDRRGYFVTLDGDKIKVAEPNDYILGIISGQPSVIGNGDEDWMGRYVFDEFGAFIYEDFEYEEEVPETVINEKTGESSVVTKKVIKTGKRYKENPNYDPSLGYIQREDRPEWDAVGMIGVLSVRDDGTCQVNGYCTVAEGGIATASDSGYRVIKRVNDNIVKVVLK